LGVNGLSNDGDGIPTSYPKNDSETLRFVFIYMMAGGRKGVAAAESNTMPLYYIIPRHIGGQGGWKRGHIAQNAGTLASRRLSSGCQAGRCLVFAPFYYDTIARDRDF